MKHTIITFLFLLTAGLFATQTERLKKSENDIFNLANKKYKVSSKENKQRDKDIKIILSSLINYDAFAKNSLRGKNRKTKKTYWNSITKEQQAEFTALFKELIETTWMKELKKFNKNQRTIKKDEEYKVDYKDEKTRGSLTMVYTIIKADDEVTNVDFRFTGQKITDFIIDDRSTVRRYRKSFSKHIRKNGFDNLIKKMKDKLEEINKK